MGKPAGLTQPLHLRRITDQGNGWAMARDVHWRDASARKTILSQYHLCKGNLVTSSPTHEGPTRDVRRGLSRRGLIGGAAASAPLSLSPYRDAVPAAHNPSPQAAGD